MTKPAASIKTQAGRLAVVRIVKQAARIVGYCLTYAVAVAGLVACQDWHRAHAINCNAPGVVCDF